MTPLSRLLQSVGCLLLFQSSTVEEDKRDPQIQAVINYFAKHGFKMEKAKGWGWHVVDPKLEGYYIVVNFKSFPASADEQAMWKTLHQISLAHTLNAPARLAMSYPGLRADAPGEPKHKAPDLKKLGIHDKMIKLFMDYRPGGEKK